MKWIRSNLKLSPDKVIQILSTYHILLRCLHNDSCYLSLVDRSDLIIWKSGIQILGKIDLNHEDFQLLKSSSSSPRVWSRDNLRVVAFELESYEIVFQVEMDLIHML